MGKSVFAALAALVLVACGSETGPVFGNGDGGSSSTTTVGVGGAGGGLATDSTGSAMLCTPGQSVGCVGPGGCQGAQACRDDGGGFEACDCGTTTASSTASSSSSATGGAQCIFANGCQKVEGIGCTGTKGEQGFTLEYKNCDTVPPCCVPSYAYNGEEYYCCKP